MKSIQENKEKQKQRELRHNKTEDPVDVSTGRNAADSYVIFCNPPPLARRPLSHFSRAGIFLFLNNINNKRDNHN